MADLAFTDVGGVKVQVIFTCALVHRQQPEDGRPGAPLVIGDADRQCVAAEQFEQLGNGGVGGATLPRLFLEVAVECAPLPDDAERRVFDPAESAAGKVADQPRDDRHEQVPAQHHLQALVRCVIPPVGKLGAHGQHAPHQMARRRQPDREAADAVGHDIDRLARIVLGHISQDSLEIAPAPVDIAGLDGTHVRRTGGTDAPVIEGDDIGPVFEQESREAVVVLRLYGGRGGDDDDVAAVRLCGMPPFAAADFEVVVGNSLEMAGRCFLCHGLPHSCFLVWLLALVADEHRPRLVDECFRSDPEILCRGAHAEQVGAQRR